MVPCGRGAAQQIVEKLLPPPVANVRREAHAWRASGYPGASTTSVALLRHGFETEHLTENADHIFGNDTITLVRITVG